MPVLGIDVGSSTSTVATISRGAIDIVLNDVSQRYTPTCVSYGELQRIFGDQANTQIVSNFKNTCRGFLNLLGLSTTSEDDGNWKVTELDKFFSSTPLSVDEQGHVSYQVTNGGKVQNVSALSALTGYLGYLTEMAEKYTGGSCKEVVLSYPSWFSEYQKSLLAAAVRATGSNCLRLISEGFAMAMDYGMYRLKQLSDESATTVALVNIGHSHTTVEVVDFFASYCVILTELSDRDLGGRYLEYLLMNEMCKEFNKKHKLDPLANSKTRLKVESTASKVKRVLSANSESSYSLECLMEDYDLNGNVKREEFEKLCGTEFLPRLSELLMLAIKMSGRTLESIHSVEVVGGITRVPCLQALISESFKKPLSKTLNADESVARGCVLQGAINSKHYMVRKYNVVEKLTKPLTVCCLPGLGPFTQQEMHNSERIPVATVGSNYAEVFTLRVKMEPPFTVFTSFEDPRLSSKNQLPTFQYTLSSVQNYAEAPPEVKEPEQEPNPEGENMEDVEEYLNKADEEFNKEKEAEKGAPEQSRGKVLVDRDSDGWVVKFQFDETSNLLSYCRGLDVCMLQPFKFDVEKLALREHEQKNKDRLESNRLKALNDLETFVYTVRDKLQTTHGEFADTKTGNQIRGKLEEVETWLYENRRATLDQLEKKYNNLVSMFEPVENNYKVYANKEQNLTNYFGRLKKLYEYTCGSESGWVNVPEGERVKVANKLNQMNTETMELLEREKKVPKHNKPLFTMEQIEQKLNGVSEEIDKLVKTYKVVEQPKGEKEKEKEAEPEVEEPEENESKDKKEAGEDGEKEEEVKDEEKDLEMEEDEEGKK